MKNNPKLWRVYTVKEDEVIRVGNYTMDERTARKLAESRKHGTGSRGRDVMLVPTTSSGKERWKEAEKV